MKKGITLVSLVITIIVLLILAGITLILTIGDRGIISRAKQAGENYLDAQNHEQEMLNNLDKEFANQLNGIGGDYSSSEQSSKFRKRVVEALVNQGVQISNEDSDETIIKNIDKILQARTSDADAIADNISEGKIAYVQGEKIIGTGKDNETFYEQGSNDGYEKGKEKILVGTYADMCYSTVTYDIKPLYDNYSLLTSDNFFTKIKSMRSHGYSGDWVTRDQTISYNSSTGILTCNFGVNGSPYTWTHVTADIYLIP